MPFGLARGEVRRPPFQCEGAPATAATIDRLGDTQAAPGYLLLQLLSLNGWRVAVTRGFAGGVLVIAEHNLHGHVEAHGSSVADVAPDLVAAARRAQLHSPTRARAREDGQR